MIDFIKVTLVNYSLKTLTKHPLLEFKAIFNHNTKSLSKHEWAEYKGLKFKHYPSTNAEGYLITMEGSLHKFYNNGEHNYNDFGSIELHQVLEELKLTFKIYPENAVLRQIEFGLNINPPYSSQVIIQNTLNHKRNLFEYTYVGDEGNYKQAKHQRYILKLYNKRKHYQKKGFKIQEEILRWEIKFLKMADLKIHNIYSLEDVLCFGFDKFINILVKAWEEVLFYDFKVFDGTKKQNEYNNTNYWNKLTKSNYNYHKRRMNEVVESANPNNIKRLISISLINKGVKLFPEYYVN